MPIPVSQLNKAQILEVQKTAGALRMMQRLAPRNISLSEFYGRKNNVDENERKQQEAHGFYVENYEEFQSKD